MLTIKKSVIYTCVYIYTHPSSARHLTQSAELPSTREINKTQPYQRIFHKDNFRAATPLTTLFIYHIKRI